MELSGKTILITGGTSGLGRQLVHQLSPVNHQILVIGRNDEKLADLKKSYSNIVIYQFSLDCHEDVVSNMQLILERHSDLSIIINNAAAQFTPLFSSSEFKLGTVATEIETNLHAPICICALAIQKFSEKNMNTAFINISSGLAIYPKTGSSTYCATKAALHSFSQSLRYQLENTNISVFEVLLPLVDTCMTQGRGTGKLSPDIAVRAILRGVKKDRHEIYVGKARLIPLISRLAPSLMKRILKSG